MSVFAFPRFNQLQREVAPLFSVLNDLAAATQQAPTRGTTYRQTYRSWTPRFSVKENETNYQLEGELPGIEPKDVTIEFTDGNVLRIHGRTESHHEEGVRPGARGIEANPELGNAEHENGYHKPSVEEEGQEVTMSGGNPDAAKKNQVAVTEGSQQQQVSRTQQEEPRFYFSERSVGEFSRSFTFPPGSVNTEEVKASLKNGILSIIVPKAAQPTSRRINIE
jgi:HSP20 family molecular chaperone IbpA